MNTSQSGDPSRSPQRATHAPALGFGCATLFGLPSRRSRRAVLEAAYDQGIRHFDVAPMYGLGLAEPELGDFLVGKPDAMVATKFGIRTTPAGRVAGLIQPPVRRIMKAFPTVKTQAKRSGSKRDSGLVGRILYSAHDYSPANARVALSASLRSLRRSHIDHFLLHEPAGGLSPRNDDLIGFLDSEVRKGTIGHWGPAGDLSEMDPPLTALTARATTIQMPYDLINGHGGPYGGTERRTVVFGFLASTLPAVRAALSSDPAFRQQCSELLDSDLADQRTVVHLLIRNALTDNDFGTVLLSSTSSDHLRATCAAARAPLRNEAEVASLIRQKCLETRV